MKFLADEGVDRQIVERLRENGLSVLYVAEIEPGISDDEVLNQANRDTALLLTTDKDFGELVFRQGRVIQGSFSSGWPGYPLHTRAKLCLL